MTDVFFPSSIDVARVSFRYRDSTGTSINPYTGAVRTVSLLGDRLGARLELSPSGGRGTASGLQDRARIMQFIARLQGQQNRAYLYDPSYVQRGTFPSSELLSNNEFASGTTGHVSEVQWTLSASDNTLRSTRVQAAAAFFIVRSGGISSLTQYAPYAMRYFTALGSNIDPSTLTVRIDDYGNANGPVVPWSGLKTQVFVTVNTQLRPSMATIAPTNIVAGSYIDTLYTSMARCIVADNGPNLALQSDDFTNATWLKTRSTVTANTTTAPDGTSTADSLIEDATASNSHLVQTSTITVSSAAGDIAWSVCLKANTRTFALLLMQELTGASNIAASFNLSTGVVGTASAGTNWANLRTTSTDLGNGWFRYTLIGRKTNAATGITARVYLENADNGTVYNGDNTSSIYLWRAGIMQGSLPWVPAATTTTSSSGTAPSGNSMPVKGLPASTAGLLLAGDQVEILTSYGSELKIVTAGLDSDAGGIGTLSFAPRLRGTVSDGAAIITCRPMGRFVYAGSADMEWATEPGIITTANFDFDEAVG